MFYFTICSQTGNSSIKVERIVCGRKVCAKLFFLILNIVAASIYNIFHSRLKLPKKCCRKLTSKLLNCTSSDMRRCINFYKSNNLEVLKANI